MKLIGKFGSLAGAFLLIQSGAFGKVKLDSDLKKASYAIGQQMGRNMKSQGVEIHVDTLAASLKQALAGSASQMTDAEMQGAMVKMQEMVRKNLDNLAQKNKAAGKAYLDKAQKAKGVKVTKTGLQYKVVTAGKGEMPKDDSIVKVHYKGTLIDGTEFDSSYKRKEPAEFAVNGVIAGWTEALKMMKPGAKWELSIPSDLAYGPSGRPGIPPNSVLNFTVELLEVKAPAVEAKK